jgi:hypothetical protein
MAHEYEDAHPEYILGNIRLLRQRNQPCIVCGHPTGDCASESSAPDHIWGMTEVPSLKDSNMVYVEQDVIGYRQITPFTKSKVLLARAGTQVSVERARELGIL